MQPTSTGRHPEGVRGEDGPAAAGGPRVRRLVHRGQRELGHLGVGRQEGEQEGAHGGHEERAGVHQEEG